MRMKFHPAKCVVMYLGNRNQDFNYTMKKEDRSIHVLDEAFIEKDLGVEEDWTFSFTFHCRQKINTATQMLNYIRKSFQYIDKEVFLLVYLTLKISLQYGLLPRSSTAMLSSVCKGEPPG